MADDPAVTGYIDWCAMSGFTESTQRQRFYELNRLAVRFAPRGLLDLGPGDLREWLLHRSVEVESGSLSKELVSYQQFYRWAVREGLLTTDPTAPLPRVRRRRGQPRPIAEQRLRRALDEATDPHLAVALALAAFAGLRAMEIAGLQWSDVDLEGLPPSLTVRRGKGGKTRVIPISSALLPYLENLPSEASGRRGTGTTTWALPYRVGPVVPRRDGVPGPAQPHGVSHAVNRHLRRCGVPDTLHSLRHRFATSAYVASKDIRAVQQLLGHQSPTVTAVYVAVADEAVTAAAEGAALLGA